MENQTLQSQEPVLRKNSKHGSICFIIALLCFFSPFFQCDGPGDYKPKVTGVFLATTGYMNNMNKKSDVRNVQMKSTTSFWAFISLTCILLGIPAAVYYNRNAAFISIWLGLVAFISLIVVPIDLYQKWCVSGDISIDIVHFQVGYFFALISIGAAIYFCLKRYKEEFKNNTSLLAR